MGAANKHGAQQCVQEEVLLWLGNAAGDDRIRRHQLGVAGSGEISRGFRRSRILEPLGIANSFASGSPRAMAVTSKIWVPNRRSCRLLMRLTPSCGEYQNSRFVRRGLLFPIA